MQPRIIRLRWRRRFRKGQRQVGDLSSQAEQQIDEHVVHRFGRLLPVRRFVLSWLALMVLLTGAVVAQNLNLSNYYQTLHTVPGGIYSEGVRGRFTNASPLYATSDADATVSHLVFAGLLKYDVHGQLVPDLASDYSVDAHGSTYTVHLKPNLTWQDGKPLTSADVAFTYHLIQNPDAQSPLQSGWQGITVTAPDPHTVVFKLPGELASFPYNLTNGIVPQHILGRVPASNLRSADFNTVHPVGAGPFSWQAIQVSGDGDPKTAQEQIGLVPFADYEGGQPKLDKFIVEVFADQKQLIDSFKNGNLTGAEGLTFVPHELRDQKAMMEHSLTLRAANMVFFKTSGGLLADQVLRQSLVQAADVPSITKKLSYPTRAVREPLLEGQLAYDPTLVQPGFDLKAAQAALTADGWVVGKDGIRAKDGKPLAFTLTVANNPDYHIVAGQLQQQWRALGAKVALQYLDPSDFQTAVSYHNYDAVLNGISIGLDPDVFVYWDSSQADVRSANRLNLSEWKNATADASLEAGRTRLVPALRVVKYKPFLQSWQHDLPALGLYQPRLLYITNGLVSGMTDRPITTVTDRLANVQNWEIRQARVTD